MDLQRRAVRNLILACALWGLSFPAVKALNLVQERSLPGDGSWFFASAAMVARFSVAALLMAIIISPVWLRRRPTGKEWKHGLGLGCLGGLGILVQVDGLAHTDASTSAFLTQGSVFFVPLLKVLIDHQKPSLRQVWCCCLAVLGVAVLAGFTLGRFQLGRGEAETLFAACIFSFQILWLERPMFHGNRSSVVSMIMFATIPLVCLPIYLATGPGLGAAAQSLREPSAWIFQAILIVPCTLIAFNCMNHWQPYVSATTAGLIYCLEPVYTSLFALFLPYWFGLWGNVPYANETLTAKLIIGGGLILLANLLMVWPNRKGPPIGTLNEHGV